MPNPKQELSYIPLDKLDPSPLNANEMNETVYEKVKENIKQTGLYPALIVRAKGKSDRFEIIDGFHRVQILKELGYIKGYCQVWDISDTQAKLLLATLNRLKGTDDTKKRAKLLAELYDEFDQDKAILSLIPESERSLDSLLSSLQEETDGVDIETERGMVEEKLMQAGVDSETAGTIANGYNPPSSATVLMLKFVFKDVNAYNKAVEYFGKKGNSEDLISLIESYGTSNTTTNKSSQK